MENKHVNIIIVERSNAPYVTPNDADLLPNRNCDIRITVDTMDQFFSCYSKHLSPAKILFY
jgi:hypothetical protein